MQFELPGQRLTFSLQYDATAELQATASYFITCQSVQTMDTPTRPEQTKRPESGHPLPVQSTLSVKHLDALHGSNCVVF